MVAGIMAAAGWVSRRRSATDGLSGAVAALLSVVVRPGGVLPRDHVASRVPEVRWASGSPLRRGDRRQPVGSPP